MKQLIILVSLAMIASTALFGCNTVSGFGRDLQVGGAKLERVTEPERATPRKVSSVKSQSKSTSTQSTQSTQSNQTMNQPNQTRAQ